MATTLASPVFAISASCSSSSLKAKNYSFNSASSSYFSLCAIRCNSRSARPWLSRFVYCYFLQFWAQNTSCFFFPIRIVAVLVIVVFVFLYVVYCEEGINYLVCAYWLLRNCRLKIQENSFRKIMPYISIKKKFSFGFILRNGVV